MQTPNHTALPKESAETTGLPSRAALATHLGLEQRDNSIENRCLIGPLFRYVVDNTQYIIAKSQERLNTDISYRFNNETWSVLPINTRTPYIRFEDVKVMEHLSSIAPVGHTLLDINQAHHRVLFKNTAGLLVVWLYTAHIPDDITSYYFKGSATDFLNEMRTLFKKRYVFNASNRDIYS